MERELDDDDKAQRLSWRVHPFPEGRGRHQAGVLVLDEGAQERETVALPLAEHMQTFFLQARLDPAPHRLQHGIAGKKHQGSTTAGEDALENGLGDVADVGFRIRTVQLGRVGRSQQQQVPLVIEGRRIDAGKERAPIIIGQPYPASPVPEPIAQAQRRAGAGR